MPSLDAKLNGSSLDAPPKLICFYLPQFYPFKENNEWWGTGFTEWTNVSKAQPLFPGHYQPHLPTEFGFYDLRVRETRQEQIRVAKEFGVDAFCYHYYWFSGKRLLDKPVDDMLADPASDMPFCLSWANENWTRRWDAAENEVLIAQQYRPDDAERFIDDLIPFFKDKRYLQVDGLPFLIVYRPQHLPDARQTVKIWRERIRRYSFNDLHVCCALTHGNTDYEQYGFDSGVEFPPHNLVGVKAVTKIPYFNEHVGAVLDFQNVASHYMRRTYPGPRIHKTVFPSWDNTARTGERAYIILNGTPANYEYWLSQAFEETRDRNPAGGGLVFINAWNEWAEGCHLEPDRKYGRQFLEATKRVKDGRSKLTKFSHVGVDRNVIRTARPNPAFYKKKKSQRMPLGWPKVKREIDRFKKQIGLGK